MYKLILLALVLSGCAIQNNKPIDISDIDLVKSTVVVSTLGDGLDCSFIGLTVFNNKSQTYNLDTSINQGFTSNTISQLSTFGINAKPLSRNAISYIDDDKGANSWANIKINAPEINQNASSILIIAGKNKYASTGGYYARDNALHTSVVLYVYATPSGRLIGKTSAQQSKSKRRFSCTQTSIPPNDYMLELIKSNGSELLEQLLPDLFEPSIEHNSSAQSTIHLPTN